MPLPLTMKILNRKASSLFLSRPLTPCPLHGRGRARRRSSATFNVYMTWRSCAGRSLLYMRRTPCRPAARYE